MKNCKYFVFFVLVLVTSTIHAATPSHLEISQGLSNGTRITLHASVRDETESPIPDLPAEAFSATVGTEAAVVDSADFAETERGVGYILLVDVSRSLRAEQFATIKEALTAWVERLGEKDRAALVAFGEGVRTLSGFSADKEALKAAIGGLALTDNKTYLHQALVQAMNLGRQEMDGVPRRRAIVTLTDGLDDVAGGVTKEEVFDAMEEGAAPIYAIGFGREGQDNEQGFKALGRFARASGGAFVDGMTSSVEAAYERIHRLIRDQYRVEISCASCVADGGRYSVQLVVRAEGATLRDSIELRLFPITEGEMVYGGADNETAGDNDTAPAPDSETLLFGDNATAPLVGGGEAPDAAPWWKRLEFLVGVGLLAALLAFLAIKFAGRKKADEFVPEEDGGTIAYHEEPDDVIDFAHQAVDQATSTTSHYSEAPPPPASSPRIRLTPLDGGGVTRSMGLPMEIGRSPGNDWSDPNDDTLSSRHARIREQGELILFDDLDSTNGTFLNGVRVSAASPLQDGDLIRMGDLELRVEILEKN